MRLNDSEEAGRRGQRANQHGELRRQIPEPPLCDSSARVHEFMLAPAANAPGKQFGDSNARGKAGVKSLAPRLMAGPGR